MTGKHLALAAAACVLVGAATGCAAASGSVEVEVRAVTPGTPGNAYQVTFLAPDGAPAMTEELTVGTTRGLANIAWGSFTVEVTAGCRVVQELSPASPTMRVVIDGDDCILAR